MDERGLVVDERAPALGARGGALGEKATRRPLEHALGRERREEDHLGRRLAPGLLSHRARIVQEPRARVSVMSYVPGEEWEARSPAALGLSPHALAAAAEYHRAHESAWPRDFLNPAGRYLGVVDEPPSSEVL